MSNQSRRLLASISCLLLLLAFALGGCSSAPTKADELASFKSEYDKIKPEVSLLIDSFQSLMLTRDMAQLHQMQLKAEAMGKEWGKLQFQHPEIDELHFEVTMALQGLGHGYGLGYIRVLRGDKDATSLDQAIDASIEGIDHISAMYEKLSNVQLNL